MSNKSKVKTEDSALMTGAKDFVAGSVGGVAQVFSGHPFDTIKVRLQTQAIVPGTAPKYSGMIDCFSKTLKEEGFGGLYKGVTSPLIGVALLNAVLFVSYGQAKSLFNQDENGMLSIRDTMAAGALTGITLAFVEGPVDLFKVKMQVQYKTNVAGTIAVKYTSVFDVATKLFQMHGIRGIFQGLGATLIRDIPANGLYFGFYELSRRAFTPKGKRVDEISTGKLLISGGIGGMAYWSFIYPIDVIKSKMQTDHVLPSQRKYSSVLDCFRKIMATEGVKGLFRGFAPCMVRSFPANATCFVAYEYTKKLFKN